MAGECFECGCVATVAHHVVPRSRGGTKVVALCGICHGHAHHANRNMCVSALTKSALAAKRLAGELAGEVPFGWTAGADGRLIEDAAEQNVLRLIIELRQAGVSLRKIASILTAAGHATKKGRTKWTHTSVKSILVRKEATDGR